MFRRLALSIAVGASFALPIGSAAEAAIGDGVLSARIATPAIGQVENAQFFFGGRNYCFYDNGWSGPGWYWCGYGARNGFGFGGGPGWNGWHRGGRGFGGGGHFGGGRHFGGPGRPGGHMGGRMGGRPMGGGHRGGGHRGGGHGGGGHKK
jgi:hypothetical protein